MNKILEDYYYDPETGFSNAKTLYDRLKKDGIKITANTMKEGDDLLKQWGKDIIGLSEESLGKLRDFARQRIKKIVITELKQAA